MNIFSKFWSGLKKTRDNVVKGWRKLLGSFTKIDEELFDQLEETMIMSDMGAETAMQICDRLRDMVKERGITDPNDIMSLIQEIIADMMGEDEALDLSTRPSVVLVIGVNGAGKTTTIGKMCHQLKEEGKRVLVAAADTFRAAAIDQLAVWTDRAGVELVRHAEGSDPAAVVFDAITAAKARGCDVVICDTAGRLHNKKNLMQELAKINRIIDREAEGCAKECLLVLDATTGQNAVSQARLFQEVAPITGIVLTKLDGTAKGGIVISIRNELGIPVKLIGVGEKIDDLQPFNAKSFVDALFDRELTPDEAEPERPAEDITEDTEPGTDTEANTDQESAEEIAEELAEESADTAAAPAEETAEESAEPEPVKEDEAHGSGTSVAPEAAADAADQPAPRDAADDDGSDGQETAPDAEEVSGEPAPEQEEPKKRGFFGLFRRKK